VAATGRGADHGHQSVTSLVTPIHGPVPTALVGNTMDTVIDGRNSIGVTHAAQCPLDADMWVAE
jgi:hypothetical protein